MPRGVYERTEENRKKIGEARRRYYDEHGRVIEIDQREDPRSYQREYQRQWRATHCEYYRDKRRMKKKLIIGEGMNDLKELQNAWNLFLVKCIEVHYKTSEYDEDELKKLAEDVTSKITDCIANLNDSEGKNESHSS